MPLETAEWGDLMDEKILAIWLSEALGPGNVFAKRLIEKYGSFSEIYKLDEASYKNEGIKPDSIVMSRLCSKDLSEAEKSFEFCSYNYFQMIEYTSGAYPKRLRAIKDPPPILYARGRMIDFDDNVCIGIVETRSYSDAGWNSTYKIASGIAAAGAVVVTGLASGIDTAATKAALAESGFCVGILGSGVEKIYPSENKSLFEEMYRNGLVISERAPLTDITGRYFPVRNRIISGLCNGVLVGEGSTSSGAMITASHALEQGRGIFAVPGDISNPESSGVNKLIRDGAVPVFGASDVIEKYAYIYPHRIKTVSDRTDMSVPVERSSKKIRVLGKKSEPRPEAEAPRKAAVQKKDEPSGVKMTYKEQKIYKKDGSNRIVASAIERVYEPFPERKPVTSSKAKKPFAPKFEKVSAEDVEKLISSAEEQNKKNDLDSLGELERRIFDYMSEREFCMADDIVVSLGEDLMTVSAALTNLELLGMIVMEGPKLYRV